MNLTQRAAGANMSVDVNLNGSYAGALMATSANVPYVGWIDAVTNCTVTASSPSNPRIDTVVAWVDLSAISSAVTNNVGAFKFMAVAGTAAGSPTAPSGATIQAAIGAGNPYIALGNLAIATSAASVVNANITDTRVVSALAVPRLWGGALNTLGHLVPNFVDDTLALLNAVQTLIGKSLSLTGNTATGNVLTNPYKFSAYRNAAFTATSGAGVVFDTELFDTSSNHDVTTGRFTAPVAGFYWFAGSVNQQIAGGNVCYVSLYKNGSEILRGTEAVQGATGGFAKQDVVSGIVQLAATDYIQVVPIGSSGAGGTGVGQTYFNGFLVSHL